MNQRKLDQEVKTLQVQAAQFAKQTGQWITMVENFNQALKVGVPCAPPTSTGRGAPRIPGCSFPLGHTEKQPHGYPACPRHPWDAGDEWVGRWDPPHKILLTTPPSWQEIGDVENWARSIEMDMRTIATALEYVYKGQLQPSCS